MSVADPPLGAIQRVRMSWEEFVALPERPRVEWVAGEVIVNPPVGPHHGFTVPSVIRMIQDGLPDAFVFTEVGVRLPGDRVRAPDAMVVERWPTDTLVTEPPVLVVEVLSPSTRTEDLIRKAPEYLAGGVGQLWLADPEARSLDVYENADGEWQLLARVDDDHPSADVPVGEHGVVSVEVTKLFRG